MARVLCIISTYLVLLLTVVYGSRKKGVSVGPRAYLCGDLDALYNIAWWYNWGGNFNLIEEKSGCDLKPYGHNFVPMIWGYNPAWFGSNYYIEDSSPFLLAFNEPNHHHQANLTAQEAVDGWPTVEHYAAGRAIVGPAAASCGGVYCVNSSAEQWFDDFFSILCENETTIPCRVSYLATHIYPKDCNDNKAMRFLENLYKKYKLKIWLTEFACPYTTLASDQLAFMQRLLPRLEEADYVYRYAWYVHRAYNPTSFVTESADLFERNSSTLNMLGQYYNDFTWEDPSPPGVCPRRKKKK